MSDLIPSQPVPVSFRNQKRKRSVFRKAVYLNLATAALLTFAGLKNPLNFATAALFVGIAIMNLRTARKFEALAEKHGERHLV